MAKSRLTDKNIVQLMNFCVDDKDRKEFIEKHKKRISEMQQPVEISDIILYILEKSYVRCNEYGSYKQTTSQYRGSQDEEAQIRNSNTLLINDILQGFEQPFQSFEFTHTTLLFDRISKVKGYIDILQPFALALKHTIHNGDALISILNLLPQKTDSQKENYKTFRNAVEELWDLNDKLKVEFGTRATNKSFFFKDTSSLTIVDSIEAEKTPKQPFIQKIS